MKNSTPPSKSNIYIDVDQTVGQASTGAKITGVSIGGDVVGDVWLGFDAAAVSKLIAQIRTQFTTRLFDGRCPYIGLEPFQEQDAVRFFGRERLVQELIERIKNARFIMVAGPSGSGKSSLVRAGLIPVLKSGALDGSERWSYAVIRPGRQPLEGLGFALGRLADSRTVAQDIIEKGIEDKQLLHQWAEMILGDNPSKRLVLIVDQFEEVFSQLSEKEIALKTSFINQLTHAAQCQGGRVTVVVTIRSDFVAYCASYTELNGLLSKQFLQVGAMLPNELVSAIARPALEAGLQIAPELVAHIIADMKDEPGVLPLMQFALKDLFESERDLGGVVSLNLTDYLDRGGLHKALERYADSAFVALDLPEQQLARGIFRSLVQPGLGTQDTRRTALFNELVPAGENPKIVESLIYKLANARLLTTGESDAKTGEDRTATLAHERLLEAWPWLKRLVDEDREAIGLANQLNEDAQRWEKNNRDASFLYSGVRLASAEELQAEGKLQVGNLATEFLQVSVANRDRALHNQRRRVQLTISALVAAMVIFGLLAGYAFKQQGEANRQADKAESASTLAVQQQQLAEAASTRSVSAQGTAIVAAEDAIAQKATAETNARISRSRELSALAIQQLGTCYECALLLGIEAWQVENTYQVYDFLLRRLQDSPQLEWTFLTENFGFNRNDDLSMDSKTLADFRGSDNVILLWNLATGQSLTRPLKGNPDEIDNLAFSPDLKTLVSHNPDNTIRLWDVASGQPLSEPWDVEDVTHMGFSPDGKTLAISGQNSIYLWDISIGQVLGEPISDTFIGSTMAFSPDGKILAFSGVNYTIRLWDIASGQPYGEPIKGHTVPILSLAFSPDGNTLASGDSESNILLWDVANLPPVETEYLETLHTGAVLSLDFSPDGKVLASGSSDSTIRLWDLESGQPLGEPLRGHRRGVASVAFSSNGKTLVSRGSDYTFRVWNVFSRQSLSELLLDNEKNGFIYSERTIAFSLPDGRLLASGGEDNTIRLWDVATRLMLGELLGHIGGVNSVAFSPDGKVLASGSDDQTIRLWDMTTRLPLSEPLQGHSGGVNSVAFSPDGKVLASGSDDQTIRLWDVATRLMLGELLGHIGGVNSVAFSPDGKVLASGSDDTTIRLWDVVSRKLMDEPLQGHSRSVNSVSFNPDGTALASGSDDRTIRLWDVATHKALDEPIQADNNFLYDVAFSPDGKILASSGYDNAIRLWVVASRWPLGEPLKEPGGNTNRLAFSPNGKMLASTSPLNSILLWDIDPELWMEYLCRITGRNFTQTEWMRYFPGENYRKTCEQWPAGE